jgi:predicted lipid-binding transport protein (Tim44 family)
MNRLFLGVAIAFLGVALVATDADARRLGGARSIGVQKNITRAQPATPPARQVQPSAPAAQPGAVPASAASASKWLPIFGGLAVGGMFGALFSGGGLSGLLVIALLVLGAVMVFRMLGRQRAAGAAPLQYAAHASQGHYPGGGYAALGSETVAAPPPSQAAGFDATAGTSGSAGLPAGFDLNGFLRAAKLNFVRLQAANDAGQLDEIREFTTPEVFELLQSDVAERAGGRQQTDVMALNAELLELNSDEDRHWASVRFSGMVRETPGSAPVDFEEVWNLGKPIDGSSGWLVAGIQQTQ